MLNQVVIVGRLVKDPEVNKTPNDRNISRIRLAVPRSYKNVNGEYDTDFLDCTLWNEIASNTTEYCKKGDILGVKGHLESSMYEKDDKKVYTMNLVAEKVTFLSNKKEEKK